MQQEDAKMKISDFTLITVIGKGSYAKVLLVRKIDDGKLYAIKVLKKKYIDLKRQTEHIMVERNVLASVNHPFIIKLSYSFQNDRKLYFVMEYCPGGELFFLLQQRRRLTEEQTRFYVSQIVLGIEHLHQNNIIYREYILTYISLKPENVLIDKEGYIRLADFGLSKKNIQTDNDAKDVVGTPEYLAPEVLSKTGHGRPVDWWTLGCIIFEMVTGVPPYYEQSRAELFDKIRYSYPKYPPTMSPNLKNLLEGLFQKNPQCIQFINPERLGTQSSEEIKNHPWFMAINWNKIINKTAAPPFKPNISSEVSTENFDDEFTKSSLESVSDKGSLQKHYEKFTFEENLDAMETE